MKQLFFFAIITLFSFNSIAQNAAEENEEAYFKRLDTEYTDVVFSRVISKSQNKTDNSTVNKYRFYLTYMGKKRKITENNRKMLTSALGSSSVATYEALFSHEGQYFWIPVNVEVYEDFIDEVSKGETLQVYCRTFTEHTESQGMATALLLDEFQ
jgi:hypothetical protein